LEKNNKLEKSESKMAMLNEIMRLLLPDQLITNNQNEDDKDIIVQNSDGKLGLATSSLSNYTNTEITRNERPFFPIDGCLHLINSEQLSNSRFIAVCKKSVSYIVGIVLINNQNEVCLIQEAKKVCRGEWYLPAGRVEPGETFYDAAIREAKEETGYIIEPTSLCSIEYNQNEYWFRFTFLARITGGYLKSTF
jgi:hypothetical protein